ncbi:hypothetical protein FAUST_9971 [Fusarium austroamericanum]|uniref:Aminoglycoside phosphotransferase domain-containing protein n=1 Tax=Fusarium austroamericanum TaxID=282268 RepID=A0AAN6BW35_FUSAU|nr:hypothetical protein FAUST_9971 [Fusarium austroamericanum]
MKEFLANLAGHAAPNEINFSATSSSNSFVVESKLENVNRVELTSADLDDLQKHVVFCHDDLEPRNILIKRDGTHSGKWHVAAIIDWEMAGFFPFAYYALFKEQSRHLLAGGKSAIKLLEALRAMDVSEKRLPTENVDRRFQPRWLEREKVEFSSDVRDGWVRKANAGDVRIFTKQDNDYLEMEILKELGYV